MDTAYAQPEFFASGQLIVRTGQISAAANLLVIPSGTFTNKMFLQLVDVRANVTGEECAQCGQPPGAAGRMWLLLDLAPNQPSPDYSVIVNSLMGTDQSPMTHGRYRVINELSYQTTSVLLNTQNPPTYELCPLALSNRFTLPGAGAAWPPVEPFQTQSRPNLTLLAVTTGNVILDYNVRMKFRI